MPYLITFVATFILLYLLLRSPVNSRIVAQSNERSMHLGIVPCFGGIGIILGALAGSLILHISGWWLILLISLGLALVFFLDDLFGLPIAFRLFVQISATVALVYYEFGFDKPIIALLIGFATLWMMNLYNFMDGLDGMAGGMSVFGFGTLGLLAYMNAQQQISELCLLIVLASLAFLYWNIKPARLFLGDSGSIWLGFMIAAVSLRGIEQAIWPWWLPIIVFLPFIADASITLIKRLIWKENIFKAHKKHYYQRLAQMGLSHQNVSSYWYGAMLICGVIALILVNASALEMALGLGFLALLVFLTFFRIDSLWARYEKGEGIDLSQANGKSGGPDSSFFRYLGNFVFPKPVSKDRPPR